MAFGTVPTDHVYTNLTVQSTLVPRSTSSNTPIVTEVPAQVAIYYGQAEVELHDITLTITSFGGDAYMVSIPEFINPAAHSDMNAYQTPYYINVTHPELVESIGYAPETKVSAGVLLFNSNSFTSGLLGLYSDGRIDMQPIGGPFSESGVQCGWPPQHIVYSRRL